MEALIDEEFLMDIDNQTIPVDVTGQVREQLVSDQDADRIRAATRSEIAARLRRLGVAMNVEILADMVEAGAV